MNDPHLLQTAAIGAMLIAVVALAALGYRPARRFIHGIFHGSDLYVVLTVDGNQVAYKNPGRGIAVLDQPLDHVPQEIHDPVKFETYFNVCWF